jgi:hypothetical protein
VTAADHRTIAPTNLFAGIKTVRGAHAKLESSEEVVRPGPGGTARHPAGGVGGRRTAGNRLLRRSSLT